MVHIVHALYMLYCDSRKIIREAGYSLGEESSYSPAMARRIYRRIVWTAAAVVMTGWFVTPCTAPRLAVWFRGITSQDASFRAFLGVIISTGLLPLYVFAGACCGCLTAPSEFLKSPVGRTWLRLLGGTRSMATHRVFCVLGALTGFALMGGFGAFLMYMAPTVR